MLSRPARTARNLRRRFELLALSCLWLGNAMLWLRTAWMSEDAFISMRTVANLLNGFGLRWNPEERVQTFSHPLWLLFLTVAHAVTGEPFFSVLFLSWAVSCAAVAWMVLRGQGGFAEKALCLVLLACSKAFVEYSSSGLENPLSHALLAVFAIAFLSPLETRGRLHVLALSAGLLALNRVDAALLVAPALLSVLLRSEHATRFGVLALASGPLLAWEIFSLVYYGFPFPNTAYAKLSVGEFMSLGHAFEGLSYYRSSIAHDPLTLGTIALCSGMALALKDTRRLALLAGVFLYLGYVVWIGGDFMQGRFFSAPFFLAVCCIGNSRWLSQPRMLAAALLSAIALCAAGDRPPLFNLGKLATPPLGLALDEFGVHDARVEMYLFASLANARHTNPAHPDNPWSSPGRALRARVDRDPSARVQVVEAIGFAGYYAGPKVHIVDHWALADPLLAHLPALFGVFGHNVRPLPRGYLATLQTGRNQLSDKRLASYYEALQLVVRGPLFSTQRWRAIWGLNFGQLDKLIHGIHAYSYQRASELRVRLRLVNPSGDPYVAVYVLNDARMSMYALDSSSTRGKQYELSWVVTPRGARLEHPSAPRITSFEGLVRNGMFSFSVVFHSGPAKAAVYDLRYGYRLDGHQIVVVREAWPVWNPDFPAGNWREEPIDSVMNVIDFRTRP